MRIDAAQNKATEGDTEIAGPDSSSRVLVIAAREDLEIAGQVRQVMRSGDSSGCAGEDHE